MKFIELFNEFYFEFLLLANQLIKKNETNKIHDLEEKITIKLQHVDVELNDFEIFENYFRKFQIMNDKHCRIKNNDVKINNSFIKNKSTINQLSSRTRRNEKYITNLTTKYTTLLKKKRRTIEVQDAKQLYSVLYRLRRVERNTFANIFADTSRAKHLTYLITIAIMNRFQ